MKFLLDIKIVMDLARWIWSSAEEVTPETCVETFPLMLMPCWAAAVAKALGVAMIVGSFLNKAPVVVNLIDTESTEGLSRGAVYGEIFMYTCAFSYGFLEGFPLTAYGENGALLLQSIVIMMLYWKFTKTVTVTERLVVLATMALYGFFVNSLLKPSQHYLLMAVVMPANFSSRGSQIYASYKAKHTGANSIITTVLNLGGGIVRLLTTLQEVGLDWPLLASYGMGVMLNAACLAQFFLYWDNTQKFMEKLEESRKPPPTTKKGRTRVVTVKPGEKLD